MSWINLYLLSEFSLLNSTIKLDELAKFASENNLSTIAICDDNIAGAFKFYQQTRKKNLKQLI